MHNSCKAQGIFRLSAQIVEDTRTNWQELIGINMSLLTLHWLFEFVIGKSRGWLLIRT